MDKSNRSLLSDFLHDLKSIDFGQADIQHGIRAAILLAPLLILGLLIGYVEEASFVILGTGFVLVIDMSQPSTSRRSIILLIISVLFASALAVGMIISTVGYLVVPLLAVGLFVLSYLRASPNVVRMLMYNGILFAILFAIGITIADATPILTVQVFFLIFSGGLWAILGGMIFQSRKSINPTVEKNSGQAEEDQQHTRSKMTTKIIFKPLIENLSIHSQYFQYAVAVAITGAIGLLITQWFELPDSDWLLITIIVILMPTYADISLPFIKVVHRILGTIIGAVIAIMIIINVDNQFVMSLLFLLFIIAFVTVIKSKNYALRIIFYTVVILMFMDILNPSTQLLVPFARIENVLLGCLLALLTTSIMLIISRRNPQVNMQEDIK